MKYPGPRCKLCRREGKKLFLKGERCLAAKCAIDKGRSVPGASSKKRRAKLSDYGQQLRAKQQIRRYYGLSEKQFRTTFRKAKRKDGITSFELLSEMEMRLDNIVHRLGMAASRTTARQIVTHGHIRVNQRTVNIPSYSLSKGDVIEVKNSDRSTALIKNNLENNSANIELPPWISFDKDAVKAEVIRLPEEGELQAPGDERLAVELYSK